MNFIFNTDWVAALWGAVKALVGTKQDKITGEEMKQFLSNVWPDGPYAFEVSDSGHLFAVYAEINGAETEE